MKQVLPMIICTVVLICLVAGASAVYQLGRRDEQTIWIKNCTYGQRHVNYEEGFANTYQCKIIAIDEVKQAEH